MSKFKKINILVLSVFILTIIITATNVYAVKDETAVFVSYEITGNDNTIVYNAARAGLQKLGYNVTHYNNNVKSKSDMQYYINYALKNYAFFYRGHAGSTTFGINDPYSVIVPSDISGVWHLVMLMRL